MAAPMGRRRKHNKDLPVLMYHRRGRYYYGKQQIALGEDFRQALMQYAELHTGRAAPGTFDDAADAYRKRELQKRAPKTQREYERQLVTLRGVFGAMPLRDIRPGDVADFMRERPPIAATREKALLSAVFNFARANHLTDVPNPCAGIKGKKAKRERYVTDAELANALHRAGPMLAAFLELCYLTGQRPSDVLKMTRADVRDGSLWVAQGKTGVKVRIAVVGPLKALLARLTAGNVTTLRLIHDGRGRPLTLSGMRKRFDALGADWQMRDLRAKAASDALSASDAQRLLGHAAASTTDGYIRQRAGAKAKPIMRAISGKPSRISGKR